MKIGIIGAGKVGCAFAIGLREHGHEVVAASRSTEALEELASRLGADVSATLEQIVYGSEIILITTPDSQIQAVAEAIGQIVEPGAARGKVFLHCSGALTSDVIVSLVGTGAATGSLHPLQTFADRQEGWRGLYGICYTFEGVRDALPAAEAISRCFGGSLLTIRKEDKALYHAAACLLSNYTVTLSYLAGILLEKIGLGTEVGAAVFQPLLDKTARNIGAVGSAAALTGPVARGDRETLAKHMTALRERAPELVGAYSTLGQWTVRLAMEKGSIGREAAEKIVDILKSRE